MFPLFYSYFLSPGNDKLRNYFNQTSRKSFSIVLFSMKTMCSRERKLCIEEGNKYRCWIPVSYLHQMPRPTEKTILQVNWNWYSIFSESPHLVGANEAVCVHKFLILISLQIQFLMLLLTIGITKLLLLQSTCFTFTVIYAIQFYTLTYLFYVLS